jgi:hypothetical protein
MTAPLASVIKPVNSPVPPCPHTITRTVSVKRVRNRIRILRHETGIAASQKLHCFHLSRENFERGAILTSVLC